MTETILLPLSGGLDSTATLHRLLTKREFRKYNIHVHHVRLLNVEGRAGAEMTAVTKIVQAFREGDYRDFTFSTSMIDVTCLGPPATNRFPFDYDIVGFLIGNICASYPFISKVVFSVSREDLDERLNPGMNQRLERAKKLMQTVLMYEPIKEYPEVIYPIRSYRRKALWKKLPDEIRKHIWYCRTPTYQGPVAVPCGKCKTCLSMNEINK